MPKKSKSRILVTSALPYANGEIHIGHLVEYIQTDIFVRYLKLIGEDAIYCCADDTHGAPIEIKATSLKMKPEELIAKYYKEHTEDFASFHIEFDSYYSTNSPENKEYADYFFNELNKKGLIYKKVIKITFCEKCKRTLPDRYVKGQCPRCGAEEQYGDACEKCGSKYEPTDLINPKCSVCGTKPMLKDSEHYFFQLSKMSAELKHWLEHNKNLQTEIKNYILNWVKEGLKDWDISRDGPYFGFKIPGEDDKYYYVWLDAPIGYISSTANYCKTKGKCDANTDYWRSKDAKIIHFIGKDIIYFHFLFWPAMLMSAGFNLPEDIVVHGFLTVNGEKMSKSRGTFLTAKDFLKKHEAEHLRYYYAGMLSKKMQDIDLNFDNFKKTINSELAGNLGNFCNRILTFINKNYDSKIGDIADEKELIKNITEKFDKIKEDYAKIDFKSALSGIMEISTLGNQYFQSKEPWKNPDENKAVLGLCANIARNLSILISPILPQFSSELQKQLGVKKKLLWKDLGFKFTGKIGTAAPLVKKAE